jgi:hypothetical protein
MPETETPAYITSLIRHFDDLRDGTQERMGSGVPCSHKSISTFGNPASSVNASSVLRGTL